MRPLTPSDLHTVTTFSLSLKTPIFLQLRLSRSITTNVLTISPLMSVLVLSCEPSSGLSVRQPAFLVDRRELGSKLQEPRRPNAR